jgi:hypothetical protein
MSECGFRRLVCDGIVGFASGFVGPCTGCLLFGLHPMGVDAVAKKYIWGAQTNTWISTAYTALTTPPQQFLQSFGSGVVLGMATSIWP